MWRETDSWFEVQFVNGSSGFSHLDTDGNCLGVFKADGTDVTNEDHLEYTCVNDNAAVPAWYKG
jgi:hypothetical protein